MSSQYHAYHAYCGDIERDAKNIFSTFYFEFITIHTAQSISIGPGFIFVLSLIHI